APPPASSSPESSTFADIFNRRVEDTAGTTAVYLQKAEHIERDGDTIRVVVGNSTVMAMLESKEHKSVLDSVATDLVGKPVSVSLIMKGTSQKAGHSPAAAKEEPLVQRFLEVFKGDLAQVKPAKEE
ncbi:MAG TPA: hypothetical protein VKY31_01865, partial [Terriglobia bacterium]|nr:hypothetical protein [Terriglobia bacterium]